MDKLLSSYIDSEFLTAVQGMRNQKFSYQERMYYMSATFGGLSRIFNIEYNRDFVFAHQVLSVAHQSINQLVARHSTGTDQSIRFHPLIIDTLADHIDQLRVEIVANNIRYETLCQIAEISYAVTGNGHYLHRKGVLGVKDPEKIPESIPSNDGE